MKNCAENTVSHIMTGKAVPRALRTLSLTEAALIGTISFWSNLFMTIRMKTKFQGLTN